MRRVTRMRYEEQDFISVSELNGLYKATVSDRHGLKYHNELEYGFS